MRIGPALAGGKRGREEANESYAGIVIPGKKYCATIPAR
jgi:hypothetical protein